MRTVAAAGHISKVLHIFALLVIIEFLISFNVYVDIRVSQKMFVLKKYRGGGGPPLVYHSKVTSLMSFQNISAESIKNSWNAYFGSFNEHILKRFKLKQIVAATMQ